MDFGTSLKTVYSKYATFSGRASRSEFWWFTLFNVAVGLALEFLLGEVVGNIWTLGNLLPSIAVACRRLHDIDKSGWWQLLPLVSLPVVLLGIGATTILYVGVAIVLILYILLIVWFATDSTPGDNRFGPHPSGMADAEIFD